MEEADLARATDVPAAVFRAARDDLLAAGRLEQRGAVLGLAGQGARLSEADAALKGRIAEAFETAGLEPPAVEDLAADLGEDAERVATLVRLLVDEGTLAAVGEDLVMHASAVEQAKGVALDLFARAGGFTTVEFRDALGTSRKFAVPLLDYFDTLRLTVRQGSRRTPGAEAKKRLG
jgi:selenocysteine-specific elongation factor